MVDFEKRVRSILSLLTEHGEQVFEDLPKWHRSDNTYDWVIAELLLRRTTRPAAEEAFLELTTKWSSWNELAKANREEIYDEVAWLGLGNQRSKHFSEIAKIVVRDLHISLPRSGEELRKLPGIGRYAAEALRLYSFGEKEFPLDSGIQRVLRRTFKLPTTQKSEHSRPYQDPLLERVSGMFSEIASVEELRLDHRGTLSVSWSLCMKDSPQCPSCPLQANCLYATNSQTPFHL